MTSDLPFLYPVDITDTSYTPVTSFNQYLSNYHSAHASLYDSNSNEMHNLFFGGMSQYYYQNGVLTQDNNVPFVKTISRLSRSAAGLLYEYQLPVEMPALKGASAEFIPNELLPHYASDIINLAQITSDTILIGHIFGGIYSPSLNPFSVNQTSTTSADPSVYAVRLVRNASSGIQAVDGKNPYSLRAYPNPTSSSVTLEFNAKRDGKATYFVTAASGQVLLTGMLDVVSGINKNQINLPSGYSAQWLEITVVLEDKYFMTAKILKN
jgi:hypothetical protein